MSSPTKQGKTHAAPESGAHASQMRRLFTRPGNLWRTRLAVLPQPAFWGLWVIVLSGMVLVLGFFVVGTPDFTANEFTVDQEMSRSHVGALTVVALALDKVFSPIGGCVMIALMVIFLLIIRRSPLNAVAFGGVTIAGWFASQFFKLVVERQRPNPALLLNPLAPETGSNSFPSGHVALAVGLAWAFWFLLRKGTWAKLAALLAIVVPLVVAWSRLYIGVHYPSDVAASFLAASAAVVLFAGVWNRYQGHIIPRIPGLDRFGPTSATPVGVSQFTGQLRADGSTLKTGPSAAPTPSNP
ncbi:phosphatase PAP2 family protein [Arthrobacter antibioticus]|uniref:phosphatase PAP2 family protein n=1 Tax=Arthrobacter sp. H35-MC1 TaxID=3046203 RepID=UPI0024BA9FA6|nr:phosphatase PAP2 family protein [Arthrobacter sp. H35-MC1]MDJ0318760.1 phosphatase PAP2 family protein [Arthrobacter sp. H35-MC1]